MQAAIGEDDGSGRRGGRSRRRAPDSCLIADCESDREGFQPFAKGWSKVLALQGKLNSGFQEAQLISSIVALAFIAVAVDLLIREQGFDAIGQLEFAPSTGSDVFEHVEDARREDVTADDGVVRRSIFEFRLLNQIFYRKQAWVFRIACAIEAAVGRDRRSFDDLRAEDA